MQRYVTWLQDFSGPRKARKTRNVNLERCGGFRSRGKGFEGVAGIRIGIPAGPVAQSSAQVLGLSNDAVRKLTTSYKGCTSGHTLPTP